MLTANGKEHSSRERERGERERERLFMKFLAEHKHPQTDIRARNENQLRGAVVSKTKEKKTRKSTYINERTLHHRASCVVQITTERQANTGSNTANIRGYTSENKQIQHSSHGTVARHNNARRR